MGGGGGGGGGAAGGLLAEIRGGRSLKKAKTVVKEKRAVGRVV